MITDCEERYGTPSPEEWEAVHYVHFIPPEGPPSPDRNSFGYKDSVVKSRAREWLLAMGVTNEMELERQSESARMRWAASLPSLRLKQKVWRVYDEARAENEWRDGLSNKNGMTKPEWEMLLEHFAGANDPTAQSILSRAKDALK